MLWQTNVTAIILSYPPLEAINLSIARPVSRTTPAAEKNTLFIGTQANALLIAVDNRNGKLISKPSRRRFGRAGSLWGLPVKRKKRRLQSQVSYVALSSLLRTLSVWKTMASSCSGARIWPRLVPILPAPRYGVLQPSISPPATSTLLHRSTMPA